MINKLEGDLQYVALQELQLPASIVTVSSTNSRPALTFLFIIQTAKTTTEVTPIGEHRSIASSILLPTSPNDCSLFKLLRKPKHLTSNRDGY